MGTPPVSVPQQLSFLCLSLRFHSADCVVFSPLRWPDEAVAIADVSNETAYMLLYRRVEDSVNIPEVDMHHVKTSANPMHSLRCVIS